jgi:hypothetical protein
MTRLQLLQVAYSHYDTIYSGLILMAVWAAGTGHLVDYLWKGRQIIAIYWTLVIIIYVAGVLFIGLNFS